MSLPNSGTCSYNGVAWTALYKSKVQVKPVRDSAGRALVAREYALEVEGHIAATPGSTTDGTLASMRQLLEKPAGVLLYTNKGFGDLKVNVPGGLVWDAAYGPWPEVLAWDPVGNDQGCLVRWRCTTQVPCEESPVPWGVLEYCWSESWDIDEDGYTTRTIDGHLTVQATRRGADNRLLPDNADAYRANVVPLLPTGFRRAQSYQLSEDKRTLHFRFTDTEIPQPLPEGLTHAEVRHKVSWRRPQKGTFNTTATISGTLTVPARTPKSFVWDKILLILKTRWPLGNGPAPAQGNGGGAVDGLGVGMQSAAAALASGMQNAAAALGRVNLTYLLDHIEIDDEVFGRSTNFSATVRVLGADPSRPGAFLAASGLWAPIPGTDFVRWQKSVFQPTGAGKPYAPRGMADMGFLDLDDAIVDLCGRRLTLLRANPLAPGQSRVLTGRLPRLPNGQEIDPDNTWLQYRLRLHLRSQDRVARHKTLTAVVKPPPQLTGFVAEAPRQRQLRANPPPRPPDFQNKAPEKSQGQTLGYLSQTEDGLQQVGSPTYTIRLEGAAVRIGYGIPTPRLDQVGGVTPRQIAQEVAQEQVSAIGGLPIFAATWKLDYALPKSVDPVLPMPVNPAVW